MSRFSSSNECVEFCVLRCRSRRFPFFTALCRCASGSNIKVEVVLCSWGMNCSSLHDHWANVMPKVTWHSRPYPDVIPWLLKHNASPLWPACDGISFIALLIMQIAMANTFPRIPFAYTTRWWWWWWCQRHSIQMMTNTPWKGICTLMWSTPSLAISEWAFAQIDCFNSIFWRRGLWGPIVVA